MQYDKYTRMPDNVLFNKNLTSSALRVYGCLLKRSFFKKAIKFNYLNEELSKQLDVTTKTITRAIALLVENGIIEAENEEPVKYNGQHTTNRKITMLLLPANKGSDVNTKPIKVEKTTKLKIYASKDVTKKGVTFLSRPTPFIIKELTGSGGQKCPL